MPRSILLLVTDLQIGGTPTVVRELAVRLNAPPEVRVDVACLAGRGPVADQLEAAGIRAFPLNARATRDVGVFNKLGRLIAGNGYETVFSFLLHANAAAAVMKPFCRDVRFLQSIQTTQPDPRWHWLVQSLVHHAAEQIVVPSPSVADAAQRWADVPRGKITVIPNAIDVERAAGIRRAQSKFRATGEPIPIGFIGRLDPIKRIPDLLHAVKLLDGKVHLHAYGEGAERRHIEKIVRELQAGALVTLHGAVERPERALAEVCALVLPSAAEGFGLVLIEAMAAGVPVVATNVAGIRDVVRDERTGLLVPPYAPAELARAIARVVSDESLRQKLIAQARDDVARRFTWDVVLPQYRALLRLPDQLANK